MTRPFWRADCPNCVASVFTCDEHFLGGHYLLAVDWARENRCGSVGRLQRALGTGYNATASFVERMEREGFLGPADMTGKREWIGDGRKPCTCHPDDNPPSPCPQRFALAECLAAAGMSQ